MEAFQWIVIGWLVWYLITLREDLHSQKRVLDTLTKNLYKVRNHNRNLELTVKGIQLKKGKSEPSIVMTNHNNAAGK